MAISERDIKLLWARAAGRCSAPKCPVNLTPRLAKSGTVVMGEMAHVIGRKAGAARSDSKIGVDDSYDNLILLCPNHHARIDKAPADFPATMLRNWKTNWEAEVSRRLMPRISADGGTPLELRLWAYFNFDMILKLSGNRLPPPRLRSEGALDENGIPLSGPNTDDDARTIFETWHLNLARRLQEFYSGLVEGIIHENPPLDLDEVWGIRKLDSLLFPTALAFINRRCIFKTTHKRQKHEEREVRARAKGIEVTFQIDTWQVYSNSALSLHFRGSSRIAALLFIRSVERERRNGRTTLAIKGTPIALGTGFWTPHDRTPPIAYKDTSVDDDEDNDEQSF